MRIIAAGLLVLSLAACNGAAAAPSPVAPVASPDCTPKPGDLFQPCASLDPTQTQTMPPTEYVLVTPPECIDALDLINDYEAAQNAVLGADDDLFAATAAYVDNPNAKTEKAFDKAFNAREAAIKARNALNAGSEIETAAQSCRDQAAR